MLVSLYFPELNKDLATLRKRGLEMGAAIGETFVTSSRNPAANASLVAAMEAGMEQLNEAAESFRAAIVERSSVLSQRAIEHADKALLD
jgi:hypothetical protein